MTSPYVKLIEISTEEHGRRVDNYLFSLFKHVPKTRIYRAIRKGEVRVNKKRVTAEYKLKQGEQIRIPPLTQSEEPAVPQASHHLLNLLQTAILYEDPNLLVINKPAGIAVHGGSGVQLGVIEALRQLYPKLNMELVHRLDRDTSGCLIVAKKPSMMRLLHAQMREGKVRKVYQALVQGALAQKTVKVNKPLFKNQLSSGERIVKIDSERGKPSLSIFHEVKRYKLASLVKVELKTGRTHQIRVHAQSLGCHLAGDNKYGDKEFNQTMKIAGLNRLFLHAESIEFTLPNTEQTLNISAPLGSELESFIKKLNPL